MKNILLCALIPATLMSCELALASPVTVLYSFDSYKERNPASSLLLSDDAKLIGHTDEFIYNLRPNTVNSSFKIIQESGRDPENSYYTFVGDLTFSQDKQFIYGVKNSFTHSAIFKMSIDGKSSQILHETNINEAGYDLQGGMVISSDGHYLYGVAQSGGDAHQPRSSGGVVYRLSLVGKNQYSVLYSFKGKQSLDGAVPAGSLAISPDGQYLYGITTYGGANNCGTLFQINIDGSTNPVLQTLHAFDCVNESGSNNGGKPNNIALTKDGKFIYGSAYKTNVANNYGIIFKIDLSNADYPSEVLHSFNKNEGSLPQKVLLNKDETYLYGTTSHGFESQNARGTVFKISLTSPANDFTMLHAFNEEQGPSLPTENITLNVNENKLYGVTRFGGAHGDGTAYQLDLS